MPMRVTVHMMLWKDLELRVLNKRQEKERSKYGSLNGLFQHSALVTVALFRNTLCCLVFVCSVGFEFFLFLFFICENKALPLQMEHYKYFF